MAALPDTTTTRQVVNSSDPARDPLGEDARAGLRWGDEALTPDALSRPPRPGQAVLCSDGFAGRVVSTRTDAEGLLCDITVRLGRIWGRKVEVPAAWVKASDRETLRLGVERQELAGLAFRGSSAETSAAGYRALVADGILRAETRDDVWITACGGAVSVRGHVGNATDRLRAESALRRVPGVREVQNDLVADEDLLNLVAQALANDERTRSETIFTAVSHGVVILSGLCSSSKERAAAEARAGQVAPVRGVSNYIEAPDVVVDPERERVVQPRIGHEVFATDMPLGRMERVVIDPHNRRVVAIVVRGQFPDRQPGNARVRAHDTPLQDRRLVVPAASITFVTPTMVQLSISAAAAGGDSGSEWRNSALPDYAWRPPYPYAASDCLWARS